MVTVMPPCSLPGFGGGTTAQSFSRYPFYSFDTSANTSAMEQQQQQRGKSIQNGMNHQTGYPGKNIYNNSSQADNMYRMRAGTSMGKGMNQRDTQTTSTSSGQVAKSRGKNMLNYTSAVNVTDNQQQQQQQQQQQVIMRTTRGKVMPSQQQSQNLSSLTVQNPKVNFAESQPVIPSSSTSLGNSSSRMTRQNNSGQDDMNRGEGGPPRVRYPVGGPATSNPLFVDCSVEYELPKMAKIPTDSLPLLMVHPKWQQNKPKTRSSSQLLQQQQQQQQHQQAVQQPHFQVMPQQQQHASMYGSLSNSCCPQCPLPASVTSTRGRKRPLNDYQLQGNDNNTSLKRNHPSQTGKVSPPPFFCKQRF